MNFYLIIASILFFALLATARLRGCCKQRCSAGQPSNSHAIWYYDGDRLVPEQNPTFGWLQFFYQQSFGRAVRRLFNHRFVCRLAGWYYDSAYSRRAIQPFIEQYHIAMDDYQQPEGGYRSFNDFFIRPLKPGARSIDQRPTAVVSPADSKVYVLPNVSVDTTFFIKQKPFALAKFLGSDVLAHEYRDGLLMVFRLAPADYHRIHFPCDCVPSSPQRICGRFDSVNPVAFWNGYQPLVENERHLIQLQTEQCGPVIMVCVGAMMVGKIVETYTPGKPYRKGDEAGYFAFGGSTVVLLFKSQAVVPRQVFVKNSLHSYETAIKMGVAVNE
jgi:phosphatidylserine decarboxylase